MENDNKSFIDIFNEFTAQIGLADTGLNEDGDCELLFDEDVVINIHYDAEKELVLVYALINSMDLVYEREDLLEKMLRSNLFWEENRGYTVSVDRSTNQAVLQDRRPAAVFANADMLATYLDAALEVIYRWREEIKQCIIDMLAVATSDNATDQNGSTPDDAAPQNGPWTEV